MKVQAQTHLVSHAPQYGEYAGMRETVHRQEYKGTVSRVLSPTWMLTVQGSMVHDQTEALQPTVGFAPANGRFVSTAATLTRSSGSRARASTFAIAPGLLVAPTTEHQVLPRVSARLDVKNAVSVNTQLALFSDVGWMDEETPLVGQYWLGGSRTLRGYETVIPTTTYAHGTLELRRFIQADLHTAVFADVGVFRTGSGTQLLWTPGVSMHYQTPVGPEVRFVAAYAPEQRDWRCDFGFATAW